jgi:hypothetical protein
MASTANALICSGLALFFFSIIGFPLAARAVPRPLAVTLAPALGWAVHSSLALPLFFMIGMSRPTVIAVFVVPAVAGIARLWISRSASADRMPGWPTVAALLLAALLALAVATAVLPKISSEGVALASPIFDHSKIAMIDEMARLGVPPADPFFGGAGSPARLSYYYLWHFSAAELSLLAGVSGWEADAGLVWFTAFASLALMIGLATWLSGRASAGLLVPLLAAAGSVRPVLNWVAGADWASAIAGEQSGFGGWLFQTSWATQHMASATSAVLAIVLLVRFAQRESIATLLALALTMAACFESSTWIGGIVFPLAAVPVALVMLVRVQPHRRWRIVICLGVAALLAVALISPFLYDQFRMTELRGGAAPIAISPYPVLDDSITDAIGAFANLPAYWLVFLIVEFPAIYITGIVSLVVFVENRALDADTKNVVLASAVLLAVSLCAAWLMVSTLGDNNDLGWRAVLPGVVILIVFAAAGLSGLFRKPVSMAIIPAFALVLLGIPDGGSTIEGNVVGNFNASSKVFAATPALWQAVRNHSSIRERVANNPSFMETMTPWPVNISWALLANRRSCYAGPALVGPFTALPQSRRDQIEALFERVFAGDGTADDVAQMATQFNCSVAVITPEDGAWSRDPFAASPFYRLVEKTSAWRIYRAVAPARQ